MTVCYICTHTCCYKQSFFLLLKLLILFLIIPIKKWKKNVFLCIYNVNFELLQVIFLPFLEFTLMYVRSKIIIFLVFFDLVILLILFDNRPNVRCSVQLQMQSFAARLYSSFTFCSVTAIAAIDCNIYVPTFELLFGREIS